MSQQMIKIGIQATVDVPDANKIEVAADTSNAGGLVALDTTVGGLTGNTEVMRIIVADNAVLPADQVQQVVQAVKQILRDNLVRQIVQA